MAAVDRFEWRPIARTDVAQWAALLGAIQAVDHDWSYFTEDLLLDDFEDPDRDFANGSVGAFESAMMIGYGVLVRREPMDGQREVSWEAGVHPGFRGRGVGSRLLGWAEAHAGTFARDASAGGSPSLSASCLAQSQSALSLHAAKGFEPVRWFHSMVQELPDQVPAVAAPVGVDIVALSPDRWDDARLVRNEAFRDHWHASQISTGAWSHFMGLGVYRPALSFVAYHDRDPIGMVISHEYDAFDAASVDRDVNIAIVATLKRARGQGIASTLITRTLTDARATGFVSASLIVDADSMTGALGVYERLGFTVEHTTVSFTKSLGV